MTAVTARLPEQFADLEPFARIWSLETGQQRWEQRLRSTMAELQAFYDAVFPRAEAILEYLDPLPLDDLPDQAINLMRLLYSLSIVSMATDLFKQPKTPDSGATYLDWVIEPFP
ncbi:hypothetical protein MMAN_21600 [Mycobacterium mantenii]|uniref:Xaa-Pro dipeptidase n=1 Tax=Mycobacterium mantenii TaxID=560555 RepID=A0A1X0FN07_MYCNT|nr:hypothetical protein [Mycobacterium mantenii]MCV7246514.1 hypothetical protein [Mycobacterium mantenii]ORB02848.1 hypothetical protein BST30_19240 [Mycobacterium mantenii]BBY38026.1 hypothetical protein MMAN_21600 [Mycobacterium mantenii]